jgi:ABC-type multidrug transport system ATPase subunit
VKWGYEAKIGYFSQDQREQLGDHNCTVLDWLWSFRPELTEGWIRSALGSALFSGEDVKARLDTLSGGEAARLLLCRLMIERPNVLVLDEPSNHLDMEANEALVRALQQFQGTVILVSHDRWFVSELATRVIELTPLGYRDYPGSFQEYVAQCGDDHLDAAQVALAAKTEQTERRAKQGSLRELDHSLRDELKRKRNKLKGMPARRDAAMLDVEALEQQLAEVEGRFAGLDLCTQQDREQMIELQRRRVELEANLQAAMARWEGIEDEFSELEKELSASPADD